MSEKEIVNILLKGRGHAIRQLSERYTLRSDGEVWDIHEWLVRFDGVAEIVTFSIEFPPSLMTKEDLEKCIVVPISKRALLQ